MKLKKNLVFRNDGFRQDIYWVNCFKKLKSNFIDIDEEIEKNRMKISKIFETKGENFLEN